MVDIKNLPPKQAAKAIAKYYNCTAGYCGWLRTMYIRGNFESEHKAIITIRNLVKPNFALVPSPN